MREQPTGNALLACARQVLRDEVLPALPDDRKHALRMVMNAMSIAERQLSNGDAPLKQEVSKLREFLGDREVSVTAGLRQLSQAIRQGEGDPGQARREAILAILRSTTRQRLSESNPKALAAHAG